MGTPDDRHFEAVLCAECGRSVDVTETMPALVGGGRRCIDHDACDERKEARSSFSPAAV
ncbi:MAG TPA: hypothetical protein VMD91_17840 [Candidatus Sulfotelmatobacter sp.]|nr:hypothetical protein [Candidatus Sulfotelmatobacter sp.]